MLPPEHRYLEPGQAGAKQLAPALGLPGWVGCMQRLARAKVVAAGAEEEGFRAALPPGAVLKTTRVS